MPRLSSILLTALLLMQTLHVTPVDLIRLDELLEHARYHQEQFGDDFTDFLSKHYGSDREEHSREHQEEKEQHEQLPFQQLVQNLGSAYNFILRKPDFLLDPEPDTQRQPANFFYLPANSSAYQSGIFQPPRNA